MLASTGGLSGHRSHCEKNGRSKKKKKKKKKKEEKNIHDLMTITTEGSNMEKKRRTHKKKEEFGICQAAEGGDNRTPSMTRIEHGSEA